MTTILDVTQKCLFVKFFTEEFNEANCERIKKMAFAKVIAYDRVVDNSGRRQITGMVEFVSGCSYKTFGRYFPSSWKLDANVTPRDFREFKDAYEPRLSIFYHFSEKEQGFEKSNRKYKSYLCSAKQSNQDAAPAENPSPVHQNSAHPEQTEDIDQGVLSELEDPEPAPSREKSLHDLAAEGIELAKRGRFDQIDPVLLIKYYPSFRAIYTDRRSFFDE